MTLVLAVLGASLLGSVHCAGMCGAFACFAAGPGGARQGRGAALAAYNGGRLVSYLALGLAAGALGAGLDAAGRLAGVSRAAAVAAGALMVGWGLARLAALRSVRLGGVGSIGAPGVLRDALGRALRRVRDRGTITRAAATGLLTTLLPCGWLYAFVVTAAGTGRALDGALVMLAFWAGTLPVMLAVGAGAQRLAGPLARRLPAASAVLLVVLGLGTIAGKLQAGVTLPTPTTDVPTPHAAHAHGAR